MKGWSRLVAVLLAALLLAPVPRAAPAAHEVRPAYLQLRQTSADTWDVLWKVPAMGDLRLAIYVELPSEVVALGEPHGLFLDDAYVERWSVRAPEGLDGRTVRIAGLEATRIDVLVRVQHANGTTQTLRVLPAQPSFTVEAVASLWGVARTYLALGVEHILLGVDHLLFVLALLLLVKGWRRLVGTLTTFTLAHSITLALASLGLVDVPGPPVEACIALSIVFVAAEVLREGEAEGGLTARAPWVVAFAFGLLHGLGFAGALHDVGLPQHAIPTALLFFNLGVEAGQLAFVAAALALLAAARRLPLGLPSWSRRLVPYGIGTLAVFWVLERTSSFGR